MVGLLIGLRIYDGEWLNAAILVVIVLGSTAVGRFLGQKAKRRAAVARFRSQCNARHKEAKIWMAENNPSKIAINAAICRLIETRGEDKEAALLVAIFGQSVPESGPSSTVEVRSNNPSNFTGHTKEAGNVEVSAGDHGVTHSSSGLVFERVGSFKLHRHQCFLRITDFWTSDITTMNLFDLNQLCKQEHVMLLSWDGLGPVGFGVGEKEIVDCVRSATQVSMKICYYVTWLTGPQKGEKELHGVGKFTIK